MRASLLLGPALVVLALSSSAHAHVRLDAPAPRYPEDSLKVGPCGVAGGMRGDAVTTLEAGSLLRVEWTETVDHRSHYRISFDVDGEDDFVDPPDEQALYAAPSVLLDGIADAGGRMWTDVRLPDVTCERCTLQLIQVMYGAGIYYQCADLRLVRSGCDAGSCADDGGVDALDAGAPEAGSTSPPAGEGAVAPSSSGTNVDGVPPGDAPAPSGADPSAAPVSARESGAPPSAGTCSADPAPLAIGGTFTLSLLLVSAGFVLRRTQRGMVRAASRRAGACVHRGWRPPRAGRGT